MNRTVLFIGNKNFTFIDLLVFINKYAISNKFFIQRISDKSIRSASLLRRFLANRHMFNNRCLIRGTRVRTPSIQEMQTKFYKIFSTRTWQRCSTIDCLFVRIFNCFTICSVATTYASKTLTSKTATRHLLKLYKLFQCTSTLRTYSNV